MNNAAGAQGHSPLSVHRAFVVHLGAESDITQGHLVGRVEHVVSGQAAHFASLEELLAFMARVLTEGHAPSRQPPKQAQSIGSKKEGI